MSDLTSKQKTFLRGLGQRIRATASVGKAGLSEGVVEGIKTILDRHELVKVHIPEGSGAERAAAAEQLAALTGSELVTLVGRMVVLYRRGENLSENRRIHFA